MTDTTRRAFLTGALFTRSGRAEVARQHQELGSNTPGSAQINAAQCLAYQSVLCMACVGPCPTRAIQLNRRQQPEVELSKCTGCGLCVSVCPNQAIHVL